MASEPKQPVLTTLFNQLADANIRYCVLHSYETLPHLTERVSDIDICIDASERKVDEVVHKFASREHLLIVLKLHYDIPSAFFYVLQAPDKSIIKLDFLNDRTGTNSYVLTNKELLLDTRFYRSFRVPNPAMEALYLLIKKTKKGRILTCHQKRLIELYGESRQEIEQLVKRYFGSRYVSVVEKLLHASEENEKKVLLKSLKKAIILKQTIRKPWKWPLIILSQTSRIVNRIIHPSGILVCFLSPDGGGKSSVAKMLERNISGIFRRSKYLHWRPNLLPQLRALFQRSGDEFVFPVTNPHASTKRRNRAASLFRWLYYSADYILGYYLKLLPMKVRSTVILMDRYYYDIIVDPLRYGFKLPTWLLKFMLPFIPKPDVVIYLDNTPQGLYARKQELSIGELERQVTVWREFISLLPNARIMTTDRPLDDVVKEAASIVLDARAAMTRRILKVDPPETRYLWESGLSKDYVALPSKVKCRWIIPTRPVLAERSWDLYLPYSLAGQLFKKAMKVASSKGLLYLLKGNRLNRGRIGLPYESKNLQECFANVFNRRDLIIAISTGTPSTYRKATAMVMTPSAEVMGYAKIGDTLFAQNRIKNEQYILQRLGQDIHGGQPLIQWPKCLYAGEIGDSYVLVVSPPPFCGKPGKSQLETDSIKAIDKMVAQTKQKHITANSKFCRKLQENVDSYPLPYRHLLIHAMDHLLHLAGQKEIMFGLSHGDFAPWNMIWNGNRVFLFDWESAIPEAPAGIDAIHFLSQTGFLLKKLRGHRLLRFLLENGAVVYEELSASLGAGLMEPNLLTLTYLLHAATVEDREQLLTSSAVERRTLLEALVC